MNEFQAILTEVIFFGLRFAVPVAIIYTYARLLRRFYGDEKEEGEPKSAR